MSEKRIRELASHHPGCRIPYNLAETECLCGYEYAMSFDPDVVALAKEFLRNHTLTDEFGAHWITLEYEIFEVILETQFHIRLTEDDSKGVCYEWVDDDA